MKEKVWNSAMLSAVLYSSETWFTSNLRSVERPYMATLKQLLKVRQSTCNDLVLVELGRGDAKSLIMDKQKCFLHKLTQREDYKNSHIERTISQAIALKTQMGSQIQDRINYLNSSYVEEKLYRLKDRIQSSESTRRKVYYQMNPSLSKCVLYLTNSGIPEHARAAATQMRLSSHKLRIETGRWARIERENRLCPCGEVQDEQHVLLHCPLTDDLRKQFQYVSNFQSISEFFVFDDVSITKQLSSYCEKVLHKFL